MRRYQSHLKPYARVLRTNQTDAERLLWTKLRRKQLLDYQFYRQKPIGPYIVDFFCPRGNLAIELDGGQHYTIEGAARDQVRDTYLKNQGLTMLRFSDRDIFENLEGVLTAILEQLQS